MTGPFPVDAAFWSGKRVFLTGHTGFKGSWMTFWLLRMGAKVHGYSLAPDQTPSLFEIAGIAELICQPDGKGGNHEIADVRDHGTLEESLLKFQPDIIIHMAAQALVRPSYKDPVGTFETNVMGTVNLLDASRKLSSLANAAGRRLPVVVVVTTDKCYENRETLQPYSEDEPMGGHDPYSASKGCAELATSAMRKSFFGGTHVASARGGNVYGGGDWSVDRILPDAARAFVRGEALRVRNPRAVRPWQWVLDPVMGYLTLARALWENPKEFARGFNFGPEGTWVASVGDVAEAMTQAWGAGARWEATPDSTAPHEAGLLLLDTSLSRRLLGLKTVYSLETSMQKTVAIYKAQAAGQSQAGIRALMAAQIDDYMSAAGAPK